MISSFTVPLANPTPHCFQNDDDLAFEEELSRNPYDVRTWFSYMEAKRVACQSGAPGSARAHNIVCERALKHLPGSYKLWHAYLKARVAQVQGRAITDTAYTVVNNAFERALVFLHKMPVIWLEYLEFLMAQRKATATRRAFDRALQSLALTQHDRVWPLYIEFVTDLGVIETAVRVYRRYLKYDSVAREAFVSYLLENERWDEAAVQLRTLVDDDDFVSLEGKSKHAHWMTLCDVISKHPDDVPSLRGRAEAIIRSGLKRFTDEVGRLWCALADFFIRQGNFERARDVYEEGIGAVMTVRDFSVVFDAYAQFEEAILAAKMELEEGADQQEKPPDADDLDDLDELMEEGNDVDLRMERLELLMDRRPLLLSSVLLRQNPHNVAEWHKRIKLLEKQDPAKAVEAFSEACKTVDPHKASGGRAHSLWVKFARFYEKHGDVANARVIFEKATGVNYRTVDDLASVWCAWAEMELRNEHYDEALAVMQRAVREPVWVRNGRSRDAPSKDRRRTADRLYKSAKLWSLYLDLEESFGTLDTTRAAYDHAIELKVATPQIILNFAALLEEAHYFEESFRVYERGVALFSFPHVKDIWLAYLSKFTARYGARKLERARDLYEQACAAVPPDLAKVFYLQYAALEEEYGLMRHAMSIYDRAARAVAQGDRYAVWLQYLTKAEESYGATHTRDIYEKAIESDMPDAQIAQMCLRYAAMERALGEVDRARAILQHASQFCDPKVAKPFWDQWREFELAHGNPETFKEMLRIQRSVEAQYSQATFSNPGADDSSKAAWEAGEAAAAPAAVKRDREENEQAGGTDPMAALEADRSAKRAENPEEIDLDDIDGDAEVEFSLERRPVPDAVFGSAAVAGGDSHDGGAAKRGALERLESAKKARIGD